MKNIQYGISAASLAFAMAVGGISSASAATSGKEVFSSRVSYKTVAIDGLDIFYREAGDPTKPSILLLHGYPSSSFMFRDLIPKLSEKFHVIAPDYPGFGQSSMPAVNEFDYTFENLTNVIDKFTQTVGVNRYSIYVQDYGSPVGFRLAVKHPERIEAMIVQNGNAYEVGLSENAAPLKEYGETGDKKVEQVLIDLMAPAGTKFQYVHGAHDASRLSPDAWTLDQARLERDGNKAIQLALFKDYVNNIRQYDAWHEYFRKYQPPTLVVWGKNDPFFLVAGVEEGFKKDLKNIEVNYYDGGHFALEEYSNEIAERINSFLSRKVKK
jgi:pimeloyl-ACP methyl ester carboxylesterase